MTKHFLVACLLFLLTGCHPDYETQLPNGYKIVRTNAPSTVIYPPRNLDDWRKKEGYIPANITQMAIKGDIVFGLAQYSPHSDDEHFYSRNDNSGDDNHIYSDSNMGLGSVWGLFILDTQKGEAKIGMRRKEFIAELKKRKVINNDSIPPMKHPSRI